MPEMEEQQPLLEQTRSPSTVTSSSIRRSSSRWLNTSSWGTMLKVETIYQPKPICPLSPRKVGVMLCILVTEMFERLSYCSVVANLILFCTSVLQYSSSEAVTISLVFSGTTYLTPIIGGYIADVHTGRFNAIYSSALIYFVGLFLLPCSAVDFQQLFGNEKDVTSVEWRRAFLLTGLALVSVGTGGMKANLGLFGAYQVHDVGPKAVQTFFHLYYWFVNAGALIAYAGVAAVQQKVGFTWGFCIPFLTMLTAIFLFLLPRHYYRYQRPKGSVLADSFRVCWQGCRKSSRGVQGAEGFFDTAKKEFGGSFSSEDVDGVISIVRMLPIFLCVVMYCAVYSQMQSTFFLQGERMNLHTDTVEIPVAMLNIFNSIGLILLIPLLDRVVYPCLQRLGCRPSHLVRIGIGFVLAALSMIAAALVEMHRKEHLGFYQTVGNETFFASNITVFLQAPQYTLVGCSEAFTSISGLEFAYTQSPGHMQGVMTGLYLATVGLGSYLASAILAIVQLATQQDPWFPEEINSGHAEYLFFLLAGLTGLVFLAYVLAAKLHQPSHAAEEENRSVGAEQSEQENSISQDTASQETHCAQGACSPKTRSVEAPRSPSSTSSQGIHSTQNGRLSVTLL